MTDVVVNLVRLPTGPDPAVATTSGAGVLHPERLDDAATLTRHACDPALSRWVEWYWRLTWDLPSGAGYTSHTLPHPTSNLSVELGSTRREVGADPVVLTGVVTRRFDVTLTGGGLVVAAKFRPGGLTALTGSSARPLRDRVRAGPDLAARCGAGTAVRGARRDHRAGGGRGAGLWRCSPSRTERPTTRATTAS